MTTNLPAHLIPMDELERMADAVAKSGLFGVKTKDEAMTLMLIAQAENMHPMSAVQEFDIIQKKPARKSWSMLARFQRAGGSFEWHERTDTKASATFHHPQGGAIKVDWDLDRAKKAGLLGKENWQKYSRNMLSARVISEGVRAVFPGATGGFYTPEEVRDFELPRMRDVTPQKPKSAPKKDEDKLLRETLSRATGAGVLYDPATGEIHENGTEHVKASDLPFGFPESDQIGPEPELPRTTPQQTDETARAETWANRAIDVIDRLATKQSIEDWLEKNKNPLARCQAANPEAGFAVVTAAEMRQRALAGVGA